MKTQTFESVLQFWFPDCFDCNQTTLVRQWQQWFQGGANAIIVRRFSPLLEQAIRGELNDWADQPRSRLALILVLDQFSRILYQGTPQAFAQDPEACRLTQTGIALGHYAALKTPWEKTFFVLPLGHSEDLSNLELVVQMTAELILEAPPEHRPLLEFSAEQAQRHRDIIARFGRHPHRNEILGRESTAEELEYLMSGQLVPKRPLPHHLLQLLSKAEF